MANSERSPLQDIAQNAKQARRVVSSFMLNLSAKLEGMSSPVSQGGSAAAPEVQRDQNNRPLNPFDAQGSAWLQHTRGTLAECVDSRMSDLETSVRQQSFKQEQLDVEVQRQKVKLEALEEEVVRIAAAQTDVTQQETEAYRTQLQQYTQDARKVFEDLQQQANDASASVNSRPSAFNPDNPNLPQHLRLPKDQRTCFVVGGLGYNEDASVLEQRAREVFRRIGVAEGLVSDMKARKAVGSIVDFTVPSNADGKDLQQKCKSLKYKVTNDAKPVWIDVRKNHIELQPSRVVRAAGVAFEAVESKKPQPRAITACTIGKIVWTKENGKNEKLGWTKAGQWEFSQFSRRIYSAEEIQDITNQIAE